MRMAILGLLLSPLALTAFGAEAPVILPAALRSVHEMSPQSRADLFWLFCASRAWRVSTAAGAIVAAPRDSGLFSLLKMALIPLCIAPSAFASPHILGAVRLGLYPEITPSRRPRMKASLPLFPLISPRPTPPSTPRGFFSRLEVVFGSKCLSCLARNSATPPAMPSMFLPKRSRRPRTEGKRRKSS